MIRRIRRICREGLGQRSASAPAFRPTIADRPGLPGGPHARIRRTARDQPSSASAQRDRLPWICYEHHRHAPIRHRLPDFVEEFSGTPVVSDPTARQFRGDSAPPRRLISRCARAGGLDGRFLAGLGLAGGDLQQLVGEGLDLALDGGRVEVGVGVGEDDLVLGGDAVVVGGAPVRRGRAVVFLITFAPSRTLEIVDSTESASGRTVRCAAAPAAVRQTVAAAAVFRGLLAV